MTFVTTSTTTTATTWTVVHYHQVSPPRVTSYKNYPWFYDKLHLLRNITFHFHRCRHDPPLPNDPPHKDPEAWEEVDPYFLDEMKLEKKGWQSFSIAEYSRNEFARLKRWCARRPNLTYIKTDEHPDCDIFAFVGPTPTLCTVITVHPSLVDDIEKFMRKLQWERPCLILTTKHITKEIRKLLPPNTFFMEGADATAISFALTPNYSKLVDLLA